MNERKQPGLANQTLLNKIDKLRELNVGSIELPQLVVVGDQSSGKSSVLESLTGFSFPQAPGLCTRYATQISCRRDSERSVSVSIIPCPGTDAAVADRQRSFTRTLTDLTNEHLVKIIGDANCAMGIKMTPDHADPNLTAFSQHILKIEMNGPEQEHFTVIDVPGIFRVPSPPLTTESDVALVRNMVESYMQNSRTIILAVLPSNVDISTQEILQMAERADPDGLRTMGVLTKPDLVTEKATRDVVKDLIAGKRNKLRLGYSIVKNRSADDQNSGVSERLAQETTFFSKSVWKETANTGRCGIGSLKTRLSDLLLTITKREFPNVKSDIVRRLEQCRGELVGIGPSRTELSSQRVYLGQLGSKFQKITQSALNGYYYGEKVFEQDTTLRLITNITKMNEAFANEVWKKGHKRHMSALADDGGETSYELAKHDTTLETIEERKCKYLELQDIVEEEDYRCSEAKPCDEDPIASHIEQIYQDNRGPELGTFNGSILAIAFKEQSEKWEPLVLAHVSRSITAVHHYISSILAHICPDRRVLDQLWDTLLTDKLQTAYKRAMDQARFVLSIERDGMPSTYNHYFNSEVQTKRLDRLTKEMEKISVTCYTDSYSKESKIQAVPFNSIKSLVEDKDNMQQIREDILDVLASYYKVARKRFVDTICRQVIGHFLLDGKESPLRVFSTELVNGLDDEVLEAIAGEDEETRQRRKRLEAEVKSLEEAVKLLRG
ncbi:interferon-induced GTP-binding protein Mx2 [Ampelomyces quisqualis]|uniref:Interferon-induced GTP-binding protein Mx2 n=1 Tax=Ampelomyces quisqualis TaxID=50730 RepID=A0A6A5R0F9_AMPQU|nr:interferon-induced GTP-binding protein Mx2 [Ampelomyces quisqualis]